MRRAAPQKHPSAVLQNRDEPSAARRRQKILWRLFTLLLAATCVGWVLNRTAARLNEGSRTAGFGRGLLHGAMMPLALPNLLIGHDVTIYSPNNTGRTYKLGYTLGVNGCGLIFFGFFFWRVSRWRKRAAPEVAPPA